MSFAKVVLSAALVTVATTTFIGVLHTSVGRPLLAKIGGCPVGKATPADIERGRMNAVQETRGAVPAPSRPALGFTLDAASPEDVLAWGERHSLQCTQKREGMFVSCRDVPLAALGRTGERGSVDDVSFAFRPRDRRLVNITATSFSLSSTDAAVRMNKTVDRLGNELGVPTTAAGESSPQNLARGAFTTATVAYRYSDFMAEITATSFGDRGVALREHYISAID